MVIKRDGRREPFDRRKILSGLTLACRKRPVSMDDINDFVDQLETYFQEVGRREVPADDIGEQVMNRLKEVGRRGLRPLCLGLPQVPGRDRFHEHGHPSAQVAQETRTSDRTGGPSRRLSARSTYQVHEHGSQAGPKSRGQNRSQPPVGAVVVLGDRVVGQGWHKYAGAPHAEPMALDQAGDLARGRICTSPWNRAITRVGPRRAASESSKPG